MLKRRYEMNEEKKEKKGQTADEAARWMLEADPWNHVVALATMYGMQQKTVVPDKKEIPALVAAFKMAKKAVVSHINEAIVALERQAKESKKKEEKKGE